MYVMARNVCPSFYSIYTYSVEVNSEAVYRIIPFELYVIAGNVLQVGKRKASLFDLNC